MITGYNTDVEHNGVVYHVQTEDKGLRTPVILSLVYTGGAILASKRAPYDDLIASGFEEKVLVERLERQHKLICAAVHAGRIEELKRMGERAPISPEVPVGAPTPPLKMGEEVAKRIAPESTPALEAPAVVPLERFSISEEAEDALTVSLLDEKQLRPGESVTLRIEVTKRTESGRAPAAKANITMKVLGSSFQPSSTYSTTDSAGRSAISVTLPNFKTGRAAILIRAEADGEVAELRRIIHPA
ncbi:MAG TPA: hypothetical protein VFX97_06485 [Pyrinomonadaceae bacterium]|nr:hypothetical protein [Pyrinomonadaceae bacterium]